MSPCWTLEFSIGTYRLVTSCSEIMKMTVSLKYCEGEISHLWALSLLFMYQYLNGFKPAKFGTFAFRFLVSKLGRGEQCTCDPSQTPACGSFNCAILITFEDRMQLVLRSPKKNNPIESGETNLLLIERKRSECIRVTYSNCREKRSCKPLQEKPIPIGIKNPIKGSIMTNKGRSTGWKGWKSGISAIRPRNSDVATSKLAKIRLWHTS